MIGDSSAEFFLLHDDAAKRLSRHTVWSNPLEGCSAVSRDCKAINPNHPLYGGRPVTLLVPERALRRCNSSITCRLASGPFPARSFFELRESLYMASPECVFLRAASHLPIGSLVALAENLCARYYLQIPDATIANRTGYLTTPKQIRQYLEKATGHRGCRQAMGAMRYVTGNSASPEETRSWVLFTLPIRYGGFGLPFTYMNYDVRAGRLADLTGQDRYSLDLVAHHLKLAFEYDGKDYHGDAEKDKRRRNDLKVLGWDVYPIDAGALYCPEESVRVAKQLAKLTGKRLRLDTGWERKFADLRKQLGLPD